MEISGYTLFTSTETGPIRTMKSTQRAELDNTLTSSVNNETLINFGSCVVRENQRNTGKTS